jgi:hypothetical protein
MFPGRIPVAIWLRSSKEPSRPSCSLCDLAVLVLAPWERLKRSHRAYSLAQLLAGSDVDWSRVCAGLDGAQDCQLCFQSTALSSSQAVEARRSERAWRERMDALAACLEQQKEDTLDITSDMLRQYKAMQVLYDAFPSWSEDHGTRCFVVVLLPSTLLG